MIFSENGNTSINADAVIAIYGEDPYAEFQGDRENLDFVPNGFDTEKLKSFKNKGIPVVSVFLSGRPLWTNPEINNSDAFIAAWLPGSEGNGVSDLLFRSDPLYDFKGRLSYSWPMTAEPSNGENLFELGYGLSYEEQKNIELLPIASGLENKAIISSGEFFSKGKSIDPWSMWLVSGELEKQIVSYPTSIGGLIIKKTDHKAQEKELMIKSTKLDSQH